MTLRMERMSLVQPRPGSMLCAVVAGRIANETRATGASVSQSAAWLAGCQSRVNRHTWPAACHELMPQTRLYFAFLHMTLTIAPFGQMIRPGRSNDANGGVVRYLPPDRRFRRTVSVQERPRCRNHVPTCAIADLPGRWKAAEADNDKNHRRSKPAH